jgi:hypothetical protein
MDGVKLGHVRTLLEDLEYPISRPEAADELQGTTLLFAGGEDDLGGLVSETDDDSFASADDLESSLHDALPTDAVGEAGGSEG